MVVGWGGRERQKEHGHAGERERERAYSCGVGGGVAGRWVRGGERESESAWLLLLYVFFPLGLPYANGAQRGALFYLESSLRSSDLSLTFFCSIFAGFSLPCLLATAILDSFSLFYLPNKPIEVPIREMWATLRKCFSEVTCITFAFIVLAKVNWLAVLVFKGRVLELNTTLALSQKEHEIGQTSEDGEGQVSLVCCNP